MWVSANWSLRSGRASTEKVKGARGVAPVNFP